MRVNHLISALLFPFLWLFFSFRGLLVKPESSKGGALLKKSPAYPDTSDIRPEALLLRYKHITEVNFGGYRRAHLNSVAQKLLFRGVMRHPFCPYMHFVVMLNLADTCRLLHSYKPDALCTFAEERNFSGPIVHTLCTAHQVRYEAFMHGECYYQADKGYCSYDRYYVWDSFYEQLFTALRSSCQFETYMPEKLKLDLRLLPNKEDYPYYATYYSVGINTKEALKKVSEIFSLLEEKGLRCILRPHPRYADKALLSEIFREDQLQDARKVSLLTSLNETYCIIAICSTVLSEAYYGGKPIVIDDYTNPEQFLQVQDKEYIMLSKPHMLLSELLKNVTKEEYHP